MMPIYEMHCLACRRDGEQLVMGKESLVCPNCGSIEVERKISRVAIKATMGDNCYPYVDHNMGEVPIEVQDSVHRTKLMKERRLVDSPRRRGEAGQWI